MYNTLLNTGYIPIGEGGIPEGAVVTDADGNKYIDPSLYGVHEGQDRALKDDFNVWLGQGAPSGLAQQVINAYVTNLPSFK